MTARFVPTTPLQAVCAPMTKRLSERLRLFEEEIFPCDQPIGMSYDGELIYNTAALRRNSICVEGMD